MAGIIRNKIEIPNTLKDFENEAEIIGIMLGDGYIHNKGYTIRLKVRETEFIENFSNLIKKTYGLKPINRKYDYPCSFVHSKDLATRLIKLTNNNKDIPEFILIGNKELKARFLRGFFDSEASVDIIYNKRQIVLTQNNMVLLNKIKDLLFDIGIQCKIYNKQYDSDKLIISLLENLEKYQKLIGFSIKYKEKNLEKAVEYLKKCKAHEKEKYWEILRHWLKSKKSLRFSAREMKMSWETYRTWVYGMKMPCQIKKDLEYGIVPEDYEELKEQYNFLPIVEP